MNDNAAQLKEEYARFIAENKQRSEERQAESQKTNNAARNVRPK